MKSAQISVFIIIGIIVVFGVGFVVVNSYNSSSSNLDVPTQVNLKYDASYRIRSSLEGCLEYVSEAALQRSFITMGEYVEGSYSQKEHEYKTLATLNWNQDTHSRTIVGTEDITSGMRGFIEDSAYVICLEPMLDGNKPQADSVSLNTKVEDLGYDILVTIEFPLRVESSEGSEGISTHRVVLKDIKLSNILDDVNGYTYQLIQDFDNEEFDFISSKNYLTSLDSKADIEGTYMFKNSDNSNLMMFNYTKGLNTNIPVLFRVEVH